MNVFKRPFYFSFFFYFLSYISICIIKIRDQLKFNIGEKKRINKNRINKKIRSLIHRQSTSMTLASLSNVRYVVNNLTPFTHEPFVLTLFIVHIYTQTVYNIFSSQIDGLSPTVNLLLKANVRIFFNNIINIIFSSSLFSFSLLCTNIEKYSHCANGSLTTLSLLLIFLHGIYSR